MCPMAEMAGEPERRHRTLQNGMHDFSKRFARKRRLPGQHYVENHPHGKEVGACIERVAPKLFRRGVPRRAKKRSGIGDVGKRRGGILRQRQRNMLSDSEVEKLVARGRKHDVRVASQRIARTICAASCAGRAPSRMRSGCNSPWMDSI